MGGGGVEGGGGAGGEDGRGMNTSYYLIFHIPQQDNFHIPQRARDAIHFHCHGGGERLHEVFGWEWEPLTGRSSQVFGWEGGSKLSFEDLLVGIYI